MILRNSLRAALLVGLLLPMVFFADDPAPRWSPPLARPLTVAEGFAAPQHEYGPGHRGIDIPATAGERVSSPAAGTVHFAGRVVDRDVITIRVDATSLVSLEPVASHLSAGDHVHQGEHLGSVTNGGHCANRCVHLGVRVERSEKTHYVNPLRFYLEKPKLIPW